MLFSSITFLYYFLPILLVVYLFVSNKYKNLVLLIFSLLFYFLGEPKYIVILLLSCFVNYYLSKVMDRSDKWRGVYLVIIVLYNVIQLLIFKYIDFFIGNVNNLFGINISFWYIVMPIGISFFTFQALGYVIDVYNRKHLPADSLIDFMTYICLFPQLVAGPIVRYRDIYKELKDRSCSYDKFSSGVSRFVIGLAKKVLIANVLGEAATRIIEISVVSSWIKPILYTLQIYFDFSGYSDMAIGLGLMFGFHFLENFNYPLIASSVTDFWRRWHISLSSWFRDYVYIPMGGNRVGKLKWFRNIFVVWFLTGFWHGASWNFIIWGLYFLIILVIEKLFLKKFLERTKVFKYVYTLLIVIVSFLIFSVNSTNEIMIELKNMFFISDIPFVGNEIIYLFSNYFVLLVIAVVGATPLMKYIIIKIKSTRFRILIDILEPVYYLLLLVLSTAFLIDASFNPFLYFRF